MEDERRQHERGGRETGTAPACLCKVLCGL